MSLGGVVLVRLRGGAGDDGGVEAAGLGQNQQAAERAAGRRRHISRVLHDRLALVGSERAERLLVGEDAGGHGHGARTLAAAS
jgi:hypothetical protein